MNYKITLVVGDWSNDGHGRTTDMCISSNLSHEEIESAYDAGTKIIGFDFSETVACDYANRKLCEKELEILQSNGLTINFEGYETDDGAYLDYQKFTEIYLFIVKLGNPSFVYEKTKSDSITIGGYGLFE